MQGLHETVETSGLRRILAIFFLAETPINVHSCHQLSCSSIVRNLPI